MKESKSNVIQNAVESLLEMFKNESFPAQMAMSIIRAHDGDSIPSDAWSLGNRMLMLAQKTKDARGYRQWNEAGRFVKKGSKAIYILAPMTRKIKEKDEATGEEKVTVIVTGFRAIPVFAYEDTDGKPLPDFDYRPRQYPPFFDVAEKMGLSVAYRPMRGDYLGRFAIRSREIQLCSKEAVVYYHELAHAVHSTFVDLLSYDPEKAEVVAEFSAVVLCELCGVHGYERQGYRYIKNYCGKNDSPDGIMKKIMSVLSDVEKIVNLVLDASDDIPQMQEAV